MPQFKYSGWIAGTSFAGQNNLDRQTGLHCYSSQVGFVFTKCCGKLIVADTNLANVFSYHWVVFVKDAVHINA